MIERGVLQQWNEATLEPKLNDEADRCEYIGIRFCSSTRDQNVFLHGATRAVTAVTIGEKQN